MNLGAEARAVAKLVWCLPSMHKAPGSVPCAGQTVWSGLSLTSALGTQGESEVGGYVGYLGSLRPAWAT